VPGFHQNQIGLAFSNLRCPIKIKQSSEKFHGYHLTANIETPFSAQDLFSATVMAILIPYF
jgi:hypothetical protein